MNVKSVKYEYGWLLLRTEDPDMHFLESFKPGKYDIVKHREKRSTRANAYMWALCREIGDKLELTADQVYTDAVMQGNVYKEFDLPEDQAKTLEHLWRSQGTAWPTVRVDDTDPEHIIVRAYYGSSTYNVRQMQRLIDRLLQDAASVGIPTPEDDYIRKLMEDYEQHR